MAETPTAALAHLFVRHPIVAVAVERVITDRDNYAKAGDLVAEILGYALAALEAGEEFSETRLEAARQGILAWHQLRHIAGA